MEREKVKINGVERLMLIQCVVNETQAGSTDKLDRIMKIASMPPSYVLTNISWLAPTYQGELIRN